MKHCPAMLSWFVCLLAAGCGGTGERGQSAPPKRTIVVNIGADPEALDPAQTTGLPESRVIKTLLDGLTRLDEHGAAQPLLAERWEANSEKTVFTFFLRDAQWTDGSPVTAEDFVYSWRRLLDPALAAEYAYQLYFIKNAEPINAGADPDSVRLGAQALDAKTLRVECEGPTPFLPELVSHTSFIPVSRQAVEADPYWHTKPGAYTGNGPFRLVEWRRNERIVVDRNPGYWNAAAVQLDRIVFREIEEESTALAAYESGEIDVTTSVARPDIPRLRGRADFHVAPEIGLYYIGFNCARAPFDNPAVRRAFALAIDRKTIVEKITLAGEEPAMAIVPPAILEPHSGQPFRARAQAFFADNDIAAAQAALAEAGYPGGRGFPRTRYMYNTSEQHKIIAEALQQMWARGLGVEVELENQEWKTYLDNRNQGNFDMTRAAWIGDIPDPINFLDLFITGGGNNNQNYSNPQFDALIRQSKQEPDSARRFDLLGEAEALAMSEFPIAPIYYYAMPYLENPRVKGIVRNGLGWLDLTFAWVEGSNAAAAPGNP